MKLKISNYLSTRDHYLHKVLPRFSQSGTFFAHRVSRGSLELIMATLGGSRGDRPANSNHQKSSLVSPEKVREILNDGVSSADVEADRYLLLLLLLTAE